MSSRAKAVLIIGMMHSVHQSKSNRQALKRLLACWAEVPLAARYAQVAVQAEKEGGDEQRTAVVAVSIQDLDALARRSVPIVSLSDYVTTGLEAATSQAAGSAKRLRVNSQALTERLQQNSRSSARGGVQGLPSAEATQRLKGTPRKAKSLRRALREIRHSDVIEASDEAAKEFDDAWMPSEENGADNPVSDKVAYNTAESFGYAAARLPGCYAVAWRVFDELAVRLPTFNPQSMLDFGAGPGTAIWAATDVWENCPHTAHAVELSSAMRWIGLQIEQQYRTGTATDSATPPQTGPQELDEARLSENGNRAADLDESVSRNEVDTASLGRALASRSIRWLQHLQGYRDRKGLVQRSKRQTAWVQSTGGRKYELVVAAYSLGELPNAAEQRRAIKALWNATSDVLVLIEPGTPSGSALVRAARAQILEWEMDALGCRSAHVVAPCPHDGRCPMDGTRSWCHFSQKLQRTRLQRHAKLRPGRHLPRAHQDERFSYVILRRGARPQQQAEVVLEEHLEWLLNPEPSAIEEEEAEEAEAEEEVAEFQADEATRQLIQDSIDAGDDEDDDDASIFADSGSSSEEHNPLQADSQNISQTHEIPAVPEYEHVTADQLGAQNVQVASAMYSQHWSRIVRPPRRRRGHMVVNICAATGPKHDRGAEGELLQQAIGSSSSRQWLGASGQRLLKRLDWGDLWPGFMQQNASQHH